MSDVDALLGVLAVTFSEGEVEMNLELIDRLAEALKPVTAPDVEVRMRGGDGGLVGTYTGPGGLHAAWADWLEPFDGVRFRQESAERVGDNLLTLGMQTGTIRRGGVQIEQPSASVWKFRDGLLARVEFHLDRANAVASAQEQL